MAITSSPSKAPAAFGTVSLGWLLDRPDLGLHLVESRTAPDAAVRWAHAIELEDPSPWLTGGELVLTTGLRLPRGRLEQSAYVERLAAVGVAALGFGVGVRFEAIPPTVQEACARLGLPLVEVPLPTPFVAISQAVAARLAEQQNERMQRAVAFQERMTRAALHEGTKGLVDTLARELACTVCVVDDYLMPLGSAGPAADLLERVRRAVSSLPDPKARSSLSVSDTRGTLEVQRLGGRDSSRGWLAAEFAPGLDSSERILLNQAASLLTLQLDRPRELAQAHSRLGSTVLQLLFDSDVSEPSVIEHLRHFGFAPNDRVRVLLVRSGRSREPLHPLVSERLEVVSKPHVVSPAPDGVFALVRADDAPELVGTVLEALEHAGRHGATIGVSGPLRQSRVAAGREAAAQAATSARWDHKLVGWYDSLTLQAILADDVVRSRIAKLAESPLAPLLESETPRDRALVTSLEIFLRHNGSWETASRALGVHRHTLRNRMAKVEGLTGTSLDTAENRVALLLALMAKDM